MTTTIQIPHDIEAEEAILGSLLILGSDAWPTVSALLRPRDFYILQNQQIYEAYTSLVTRGIDVDFITVSRELETQGNKHDSVYLSNLFDAVPTALHAEQYARRVQEMAIRRDAIRIASKIVQNAHDRTIDVDEMMRIAEGELLSVYRNGATIEDPRELFEGLHDQIVEWAENPLRPGETRYLSTGIRPLDDATGGLDPGFYLFAGRTSMGKTAVVLQIAANIVLRGQKVMVFSLEMNRKKLAFRMACTRARVTKDSLERGTATQEEHRRVTEAIAEFWQSPLIIHYSGTMNPRDIRAMVHKEMIIGDVAVIVVDGIWLMSSGTKTENRNLELTAISREMKLLADTTKIPLLTTHQLSRACELRSDKRPLLSDLRDSGSLEQDADKVWMIYRDGYYMDNGQRRIHPKANTIELINRKNRDGQVGDVVEMFWQEKYACMDELAPRSLEVY